MTPTPPDDHRRRQLLLLCVVMMGLFGTARWSQTFPVCDISCCTVLPSCRAALRVMCNCTQQDSMELRKGDIPKSVLAIHIRNARNIAIDKDAVYDLKHLTNFSLQSIDQVEIRENGMAFEKQSNIRSVKFQDIQTLRIKNKAFSGIWETRTSISIGRTTELHLESNAFGYRSRTLGPSLRLQQVGMLNLDSKGFAAPLYSLDFDNVTMDVCHDQSFNGKISRIQLNKVKIEEAKAGCFSDLGSLSTLSIQSSTIKTVHPQAFSGNIHELIIKNSSFTSMDERSLDIRTESMQITSTQFKHLSANALSVMATDLRLENNHVDFLGKHALAGLQVQRSEDGNTQPLIIRKLNILNAENSSLVFSDCTEIQMTDLDIVSPWPRVCPTERWARQLVGANTSGQLNPAQVQVLMQLFDMRLCSENFPSKESMTSQKSPHCATLSRNTSDQFEDHQDPLQDADLENEEADTPRGNVSADASHEVDNKQPSRWDDVSTETSVSTASNAGSPDIAAKPAASSVLAQTEAPAEVAGGSAEVHGDSPVDVHGDRLGDVHGDRPSDVHGDRPRDVHGDRPVDVHSDRPGDVHGDRPGNVHSDRPGDVHGDRPGEVHGDRPGEVHSDRPGEVHGSIRKSAPTEPRDEAVPARSEPVPSQRPTTGDGLDGAPAGATPSPTKGRLLEAMLSHTAQHQKLLVLLLLLVIVLALVVPLLVIICMRGRQPTDDQMGRAERRQDNRPVLLGCV